MLSLNDWKQLREDRMSAARQTRRVLTEPDGYWGYDKDDQRVKSAVGVWVRKAWRAHDIYMGFAPIIENFTLIHNEKHMEGSLYAREQN